MENENITEDIKENKIKNGEIHKLVYWLRVNTFRRLIEIVGQFWRKGSIKSEPNSSGMKIKEVSAMISKKISVKFNSCCVSYAVKATLDENNTDYLAALDELKDQLILKVQEALNGKKNGNGKEGANEKKADDGHGVEMESDPGQQTDQEQGKT